MDSLTCASPSCTSRGKHIITCVHCKSNFHHSCLGWEDVAVPPQVFFACQGCQAKPSQAKPEQQKPQRCFATDCPRTGLVIVTCRTCDRRYHLSCLGWEDTPLDVTGLSFHCEICRTQTSQPTKFQVHSPPRSFQGQEHEDPQLILSQWEKAFQAQGLHPAGWLHAVSPLIQGEAEKWWHTYEGLFDSWEEFKEGLLRQFGNQSCIAQLTARLYGVKQTDHEDVQTFLLRKQKLFQRLYPGQDIGPFLPTLTELLLPSLRPFLRNPRPYQMQDLVTRAIEVQMDFQQTQAYIIASTVQSSTRKRVPDQTTPKCWHCPGYHLHKDCKVAQQRLYPQLWNNASQQARVREFSNTHLPNRQEVHQPKSDRSLTDTNIDQLTSIQHDESKSLPRIPVYVGLNKAAALIDTAATTSFVKSQLANTSETTIEPLLHKAKLAQEGATIALRGQAKLKFLIGEEPQEAECLVADELVEDLILGQDWLEQQQAVIDFKAREFHFGTKPRQTQSWGNTCSAPTMSLDPEGRLTKTPSPNLQEQEGLSQHEGETMLTDQHQAARMDQHAEPQTRMPTMENTNPHNSPETDIYPELSKETWKTEVPNVIGRHQPRTRWKMQSHGAHESFSNNNEEEEQVDLNAKQLRPREKLARPRHRPPECVVCVQWPRHRDSPGTEALRAGSGAKNSNQSVAEVTKGGGRIVMPTGAYK